VQCTKTGSMWRIKDPYKASRLAEYEDLNDNTVHRGRQHVRNYRTL
jgi:hypothetical protein